MAESNLQQQANHNVNAAAYGRQADLDPWVQHVVNTSLQRDQRQQQQAHQEWPVETQI